MRLLIVMTYYPFPPRTGSEIVAYNNIRWLSKKNSIYFICLENAGNQNDFVKLVEQIEFVGIERTSWLYKKLSWLKKIIRCGFYLLLGVPVLVSAHMSAAMRKRVGELINSENFDAILLFELCAIQYCPVDSYKNMIVNIEDPQSLRLEHMRELQVWPFWQKIKLSVFARLTKRYEFSCLPQIGKVLLLSENDLRDMKAQGKYENLGYVSYGVKRNAVEEITGYDARTKGMIVVSGNMYHPSNVDGILYFLKKIFLLVLRECPYAKLWIVGAEPDTRILAEASEFGDRVVITGKVNDVFEYIKRATVSVCPVRTKIGVQTKILEALSWGTPVVTTKEGNNGIGGSSGNELWVADGPEDFSKYVVSLLQGEGWNRLSEKGRMFATEHHSWERSATMLEQYIEQIQKVNQCK